MKTLQLAIIVCLTSIVCFSQTPLQFKYQAVIRNPNGEVQAGKPTAVTVEILHGGITGPTIFSETHNVTTTDLGLVNLTIGSLNGDDLAIIDWSNGPYFLKISVNGVEMGISQLLSVPYALQARFAEAVDYANVLNPPAPFSGSYNDLTDTPVLFSGSYNDLSNKPAQISQFELNANQMRIENIAAPVADADAATKGYVDEQLNILQDKLLSLQAEIGAKDSEGNVYKAVKIGSQVWMAENLRTTTYDDGTSITLITDNTAWGTATGAAYSWYNNDEVTNKETYGALYNWHAVNTGKLCPTGWHVPSFEEWQVAIDYLGGVEIAGGELKEAGTNHWNAPNTGATNGSGFTGLPGGSRSGDSAPGFAGEFFNLGIEGDYWTSTLMESSFARFVSLGNSRTSAYTEGQFFKTHGISVRCIHN